MGPIVYPQSAIDEINNFIGSREQVVTMCDFTIRNIGWSATAVLTENRISFFTFRTLRTGDLELANYAEIGLKEIKSLQVYPPKKGLFVGEMKVGHGLFVFDSQWKEDAERFFKLTDRNRETSTGFKGWQDLYEKFDQNIDSWFNYLISQNFKTNPQWVKNRNLGCLTIFALFILGILIGSKNMWLGFGILGVIAIFIFIKGRSKCPNCNTYASVRPVDRAHISGKSTFNEYYHCESCGYLYIREKFANH